MGHLNAFDTELEERTSPDDRPKRASVGATVPIPVGKGRKWGDKWGSVMQAIFGGWNVSLSYQYQQGFPLSYTTNGIPGGWPAALFRSHLQLEGPLGRRRGVEELRRARSSASTFPPGTRGASTSMTPPCRPTAWTILPSNGPIRESTSETARATIPTILDNMRMPNLHLLDLGLSKWFDFGAGVQLQIRIDAINAIDYTVYWLDGGNSLNPRNANFGKFTSARNNPRDIQLGARLTF